MGAFIYYEQQKAMQIIDIDHIIDDQSSTLLLEVAKRIYHLPTKAENFADSTLLRKELDEILPLTSKMTKHLLSMDLNVEGNSKQIDQLQLLKKTLRIMQSLIGKGNAKAFDYQIHRLHQHTYDLNRAIVVAQENRTQLLVAQLSRDRRQRLFFTVVALICGLALVAGLIEGIYHYRQHAERAKAAEGVNALFAAALESTRVGVLIRDMSKEDAPVVFVNRAFEDMTGYKFSEIPSDNERFLFGWKTDNKTISAFRRATSLRESATLNLMVYRKDGSPFWSEWHLSPIVGDDGKASYFVSLFSDMTTIRQTQDDLMNAKQLAERAAAVKTNFLAMMSHEIRTPINGIQGVLKLIDETDMDDEQKHLLGIAITSSKALHRIINDILDYAKMEAGKVKIITEPFVLQTLLDGVVSLGSPMFGGKKVKLDVSVLDGMPSCLMGDVGRLHQILLNLVSNAIKFTDEGFVHIRVLPLMEQKINGKDGMLVRFEVQDTGVGIPSSEQDKLFQEFSQLDYSTTRRFGGTGLGLAICKRLVVMLGGEIGVESHVGKGSKFWFMLPLACAQDESAKIEEVQQEDAPPRPIGRPPERFRILLVEDNETNRLVASRYLEKAGFKVEEACDGVQAVEKAKQRNYDLVLMDISMPEMDGMLATCHIRAEGGHNATMPIIALTAHAMAGDRDLCLEVGMNDYLHKPIEYDQLVKTLERWLDVEMLPAFCNKTNKVTQDKPTQKPKPKVVSFALKEPDVNAFDAGPLDRMKDMLGAESVGQVIDSFLQDSPGRVKLLDELDLVVVRDSAHTLKSSAGNCGLKSFSRAMADLEMAADNGKQDQVDSSRDQGKRLYKSGIENLRAYYKAHID